ncbi:hypothetical protein IWX92DRAFT_367563 [Phyllosticta citricarpa]
MTLGLAEAPSSVPADSDSQYLFFFFFFFFSFPASGSRGNPTGLVVVGPLEGRARRERVEKGRQVDRASNEDEGPPPRRTALHLIHHTRSARGRLRGARWVVRWDWSGGTYLHSEWLAVIRRWERRPVSALAKEGRRRSSRVESS